MTTDDHLILDFQRGSRDAFRELFERYREAIFGFFRRRLDDPARAEELTQDCFLALLQNAARYEPRGTFRSYLFGIATNMVHAEWRKSGREIRTDDPERASSRCTTTESEAGVWIRQALDRLQPSDREILMLREYEQLSYGEIGAMLRLPLNTVRSRLFRARMALKDELMPAKNLERGKQ